MRRGIPISIGGLPSPLGVLGAVGENTWTKEAGPAATVDQSQADKEKELLSIQGKTSCK